MARNFTQKISVEELSEKVFDAIKRNAEAEDYLEDGMSAVDAISSAGYVLKSLTPTIESDLLKVEFDCENIFSNQSEDPIAGFRQIGDLVYLGVVAGGDWENPLYFIIYWDGKKLRGYIPEDGNPWNTKTNSAYGNSEDEDEPNSLKRFGTDDYQMVSPDITRIENDIRNRIQFKS